MGGPDPVAFRTTWHSRQPGLVVGRTPRIMAAAVGGGAFPVRGGRPEPGAIGIDWFSAGWGGVPWLISRPRKKLIEQQLPNRSSLWLPD